MDPVSGPGEGEVLAKQHRDLRIKALIPELNLLEYDVGPEYTGASPHYHKRHADSFYVLEGELEFQVGGETVRAPAGTSVVVPPGVVHAFTNPGLGRARFLNIHTPESGFIDYLRARDRGEDVDPAEYDIFDVE
jgi:mannose-6-phosphate isomerase-like protein (cupin superfamily)